MRRFIRGSPADHSSCAHEDPVSSRSDVVNCAPPVREGVLMRRPRMSTGAWIFAGLICAAVVAPASVYAAAVAKTAIVGSSGTTTVTVTQQHQLLAALTAPSRVVRAVTTTASANTMCQTVYTPPPGKAIVVTAAIY